MNNSIRRAKSIGRIGQISQIRLITKFSVIRLISQIGLIGLIGLVTTPLAFAQSKNLITVTPQLIQLDLSKDNPEADFTYINSTNQTIELTLSMQDVKELEDRGIPDLLDASKSKNYKYGLSSWATFSNKNLVIAPKESKTVTIYIDKTRLSQGGHYASVLAEIKQLSSAKTVQLRAILASLLFVRTGSEFEVEQANISELRAVNEYLSFPGALIFKLQNIGNVDLTPYGIITIKDPFGSLVSRNIVNENSLITLPDSVRKYTTKITKDKKFLVPGYYKSYVEISYGKKKVKITKEITFFSLGSLSIKTMTVALLLLVAAGIIAIKIVRKKRE